MQSLKKTSSEGQRDITNGSILSKWFLVLAVVIGVCGAVPTTTNAAVIVSQPYYSGYMSETSPPYWYNSASGEWPAVMFEYNGVGTLKARSFVFYVESQTECKPALTQNLARFALINSSTMVESAGTWATTSNTEWVAAKSACIVYFNTPLTLTNGSIYSISLVTSNYKLFGGIQDSNVVTLAKRAASGGVFSWLTDKSVTAPAFYIYDTYIATTDVAPLQVYVPPDTGGGSCSLTDPLTYFTCIAAAIGETISDLFIPSTTSLTAVGATVASLSDKAPFGYVIQPIAALASPLATTTAVAPQLIYETPWGNINMLPVGDMDPNLINSFSPYLTTLIYTSVALGFIGLARHIL